MWWPKSAKNAQIDDQNCQKPAFFANLPEEFCSFCTQLRSGGDDERPPHHGMRGAVIGKAPGSRRDVVEALTAGHLRRTPCPRVGRGRVREWVVVGPHDGIANRYGQIGWDELELRDGNRSRLCAGCRRHRVRCPESRGAARYAKHNAESTSHFFASTSALTCSACARCAATAGRTAVSRLRSSAFLAAGSIWLSIDARNF